MTAEIFLMKPITNLNGTSAEAHINQRIDARHALFRAIEELQKLWPHGRDYPGADDQEKADRAIAQQRITTLSTMAEELLAESFAIQQQQEG